MTKTALIAAARRWARALNNPGDRDAIETAFAPRPVLWRYTAGEPDSPSQRISGLRTIEKWVASAPAQARFTLVPKSAEPDPADAASGTVRYKVKVGPFVNHGTWTLTLSRDGRIRSLLHRPDELPARWRVGEQGS